MLRIVFYVAIAMTSLTAQAQDFVLVTSGGPGETTFRVEVKGNKLNVVRKGMPFTVRGFTARSYSAKLRLTEVKRLYELALAANDFSQGCGKVADGTSALLTIDHNIVARCDNAPQWPVGKNTRALLDAINAHLSVKKHVY